MLSEKLNKLLIKVFNQYKDSNNPPVPIPEIRDFLEFEGIDLDDEEGIG